MTSPNIFLHSAHSDRVKSGVIIDFYLRALRISGEEYSEEMKYIMKGFSKLSYSIDLLCNLRDKAIKISRRSNSKQNNSRSEGKYMCPQFQTSHHLSEIF